MISVSVSEVRLVVSIALCCASLLIGAPNAAGQDLFELEVFDYEEVVPGGHEVAVHANGILGRSAAADSIAANHRPTHVSVEISRAWTGRLETAVFLQTAPLGVRGSERFAGGHLRTKVRVGRLTAIPIGVAVSAEYAFNRSAFDRELQTFELRSILQYERGRFTAIMNPSFEVVTRGSDEGLQPVADISARTAWRLTNGVSLTGEYFSAAATTRHLRPELGAHHIVFAGADFDVTKRWELGFGAGHCLTTREPWVLKSVLAYHF